MSSATAEYGHLIEWICVFLFALIKQFNWQLPLTVFYQQCRDLVFPQWSNNDPKQSPYKSVSSIQIWAMECHNSLNQMDFHWNCEWLKLRETVQICWLPHEMRAPGKATIGNTPNKSITQSVAKNTLSPRVGRKNCRKNRRSLLRNDGDANCFTTRSCSIFAKGRSPKWTPAVLFDR